jgi:acetyl-CoA carboxylase biotin carboxyl carrier protein
MIDDTIAERIRPLAAAFLDGGYARLHVRDGEFEVEFRRTPALPSHIGGPADAPAEAADARPLDAILADVVGIVRFTHPPLCEGMSIDGDRELAFVETLGIRNGVRSRGAGRVAAVYVADGQPVEYGQPLFAMER